MPTIERSNIIPECQKLGIPIFTSGSREFELSAATSNFLYRFYRPGWVVRPRNGEDVATIVGFANQLGARITVKNGGHSYAGYSNAPPEKEGQIAGILLDMCDMKAVSIDAVGSGKVMTCSAGALWGDVYRLLAAGTETDKWILNGGRCPAVGVAGFILGGGFGPFSRSVGIGADQLKEVEIVTVNGEVITLNDQHSQDSDEGKLFWALRGGGGGMLGIVTKMKIRVCELKDADVVSGRLVWRVDSRTLQEFRKMMADFYQAKWDNHCTIDSTWSCDLSSATDTEPFSTRFITYHDGDKKSFENEIRNKLKASGDPEDEPEVYKNVRKQIIRRAIPEPCTLFLHETLWAQWSEETRRSQPTERAYTMYSSFVIENNEETIEGITQDILNQMSRFRQKFKYGERGVFEVTWIHVGGKISEVPENQTAYPWRKGNYCVYILLRWNEKWLMEEMKAFFTTTKEMLRKHAIEKKASYINFADRLIGSDFGQAYYGNNLTKMKEVYTKWVTERLVCSNDNISRNPLRFDLSIGELQHHDGATSRGATSRRGYIPVPYAGSASDDVEERHRFEAAAAQDEWDDWRVQWRHYRPPTMTYEDYAPVEAGLIPKC